MLSAGSAARRFAGDCTAARYTGEDQTKGCNGDMEAEKMSLTLQEFCDMDGYKATQTIRRLSDPKKAGITIVAMTANAFEEDKANAFRAGMNRHIAKPIKVEELMSALTEILREQA